MKLILHFLARALIAFVAIVQGIVLFFGPAEALVSMDVLPLGLLRGLGILPVVGALLCVRDQDLQRGAGLLALVWIAAAGLEPMLLLYAGLAAGLALLPIPTRLPLPKEQRVSISVPVEGAIQIQKGPPRPKAKLAKIVAWWDTDQDQT